MQSTDYPSYGMSPMGTWHSLGTTGEHIEVVEYRAEWPCGPFTLLFPALYPGDIDCEATHRIDPTR